MASEQLMAVNNNEQNKEMVHQMVEKAKRIAMSQQNVAIIKKNAPIMKTNNNGVNQSQKSAVVCMNNGTTAMVNFNQNYDWSGAIIGGSYPPAILSNSPGQFIHAGVPNTGSSGAVIYYGMNKQNVSCAWLLAWSAPTSPSASAPNKVYVDCGPSTNFGPTIDWSAIQTKLNASGNYSNHWDPVTKTTVDAQINLGDSSAAIGANFGAN